MLDDEALVVLRDAREPVGEVVHQVSARVFVARLDEGAYDLLSHDPRVAFIGDQPPRDIIDGLEDQERLFVDGWLARGKQTRRIGEGLSWDAEGMTPPDLPRHPG
ncbi:MAG: hypothetical protein M3493_11695 [Actinomycetota bacterium]|jgi:hypothetical protein|nr:hypothetical protein [Euzebyaceae bacterium]MDQ3453340.1 hypothetical protein [Actinomycetota bacterium]